MKGYIIKHRVRELGNPARKLEGVLTRGGMMKVCGVVFEKGRWGRVEEFIGEERRVVPVGGTGKTTSLWAGSKTPALLTVFAGRCRLYTAFLGCLHIPRSSRTSVGSALHRPSQDSSTQPVDLSSSPPVRTGDTNNANTHCDSLLRSKESSSKYTNKRQPRPCLTLPTHSRRLHQSRDC